jgi:hypothetical protein
MRIRLFSLTIFILVFSFGYVFAQDGRRAKIVLKNGNKLVGGSITAFDEKTLKFSIDDQDDILIRYDLIKKIHFKGSGNIDDDFADKIGSKPTLKTKSFYHQLEGTLLFGQENTSVGLQTINGYQFTKYIGTGLGVGLNKYGNYVTLPVYAQIKGYLLEQKVSPFYFGDIGYGFAWKSANADDYFDVMNVTGGLYWQLGLGYQINFYKSSMTFSFGYINQDSRSEYTYLRPWDIGDVEVTERRILRRVAFSVGFLF